MEKGEFVWFVSWTRTGVVALIHRNKHNSIDINFIREGGGNLALISIPCDGRDLD